MRILFITATRIGDAVLSTGLIAHLLERYPQALFTVACGPAAAGVFARMPRLERMILIEKRSFDRHWLTLWSQLCLTWWDQVVDLRGSALAFTIPARRRFVMRGGRRPGHRLTHLASVLGLAEPPRPVVWTAEADRALAETLVPSGAMGLGPTANWDGKVWPADRFVELVQALAIEAPVVVFAGPGAREAAGAAPVVAGLTNAQSDKAIDLAGRLTLAEAAACLARCRLFVGNDSGLMHLAAAAGTPTLGLFGPSRADEYAPVGRATAVAVADGPVGAAPMESLPVERVMRAAQALLVS